MFCKNCGKEIPDNSHFCQHCGAVQIAQEAPQRSTTESLHPQAPPQKEKRSGGCFLKVLGCILLLVLLVPIFEMATAKGLSSCANSNSNSSKPFTRDATNADVHIDFSYPSLTSVCITIRPYHDIDNLKLTIKYLDKNGNTITSEQKTIGNVKEGMEYNTYLNVLEFPSKTDKYSVGVSGGTVSYLQ